MKQKYDPYRSVIKLISLLRDIDIRITHTCNYCYLTCVLYLCITPACQHLYHKKYIPHLLDLHNPNRQRRPHKEMLQIAQSLSQAGWHVCSNKIIPKLSGRTDVIGLSVCLHYLYLQIRPNMQLQYNCCCCVCKKQASDACRQY